MTLSDFIGDDTGKWEMMHECADQRDKLTLDRLDRVAEKLFNHMSEKLGIVDRCEVYTNPKGKMYSGAVYINCYLENQVIVQFEYNLKMILKKVNLQYYQLEKELQQKQQSITPPALLFKPTNMIDFLCSEDKQKEWVNWHDVKFLDLVDDLIKQRCLVTEIPTSVK